MSNEVQTTRLIEEYNPTEAALAELRERYAGVIFPVETKEGMKDAKEVRQKLVKLRTGLEAKRKEIKEPALRRTQAIDAEARSITSAIKEIEEPIDLQIKAEQERVEAEKRAAEARRAEIKSKIDGIRTLPQQLAFCTSAEIEAERAALEGFEPSEDVFGDQYADCVQARTECLDALSDLYNRVMAQETVKAVLDAARNKLAEERAELDRLRADIDATRTAQFDKMRADMMNANPLASTVAAPTGAGIETAVQTEEPDEPEQQEAPLPTATEWKIRRAAMATADQFEALAEKTALCGVYSFAKELRDAADMLRNGDFDGAMAEADAGSMVAADVRMLDATAEFIEAMAPVEQQEAAE